MGYKIEGGEGSKTTLTSLLISNKDYDLFKMYAKNKNWSLAQLLRRSALAVIYMDEKNLTFSEALEKAITRDSK